MNIAEERYELYIRSFLLSDEVRAVSISCVEKPIICMIFNYLLQSDFILADALPNRTCKPLWSDF